MSHGREVHVKSDFPSGYGGHVPAIRHDILFKNTSHDRKATLMRTDPSRDAFPSFVEQINGIPSSTKFPQGAKKNPTYGVVPHDGTTTMLRPPWGVMTGKRDPLNHRSSPPTMVLVRSSSSPTFTGTAPRVNQAAQHAGAILSGGFNAPDSYMEGVSAFEESQISPGAERLKRTVHIANEEALRGRMPREADILAANLG